MKEIVYGVGGHDPTVDNNNIVEVRDLPELQLSEEQRRIAELEEALAVLAADILGGNS